MVGIGLFAAESGYPIDWEVWPGKEMEKTHVVPALKEIEKNLGVKDFQYESDRANRTGNIIAFIHKVDETDTDKKSYTHEDPQARYIVAKSIRQATASLKEFATEADGYQTYSISGPDQPERTYRLKYRTFDQPIYFTTGEGKKRKIRVE